MRDKIKSLIENNSGEIIGEMVIKENGTFEGRFSSTTQFLDVFVDVAKQGFVNGLILKPKLIPAEPATKSRSYVYPHSHSCDDKQCPQN